MPKEMHSIPLGEIGREQLMKVATILCVLEVSVFFSHSCYTERANARAKTV